MKHLFLALCSEPYKWFNDGIKEWELRKLSKTLNPNKVHIGDIAELRRGYVAKNGILWGKVTECKVFSSLKEVFSIVPYDKIIKAETLSDAIHFVSNLMHISYESQIDLMAIKIEKLPVFGEIIFDDVYLPMITNGIKTTTVREGVRNYSPGLYNAFNPNLTSKSPVTIVHFEEAKHI